MVSLYVKIKTEYVHSSGIVEFIFLIFTLLMLIIAVLRAFKLKKPIHGEDPEKPDVNESQSKESKYKEKPNSDAIENLQQDQQKESDEVAVKNDEVGIAIDEDDEDNKEVQQEIVSVQTKKEAPEEKKENVQPKQPQGGASEKSGIETFGEFIDAWVDKYLVALTIAILLINSWGCYIYTAFITTLCVFLGCLFNTVNITSKMTNPGLQQKRGFLDLIFHFWVITLFVAYFINDQALSETKA